MALLTGCHYKSLAKKLKFANEISPGIRKSDMKTSGMVAISMVKIMRKSAKTKTFATFVGIDAP